MSPTINSRTRISSWALETSRIEKTFVWYLEVKINSLFLLSWCNVVAFITKLSEPALRELAALGNLGRIISPLVCIFISAVWALNDASFRKCFAAKSKRCDELIWRQPLMTRHLKKTLPLIHQVGHYSTRRWIETLAYEPCLWLTIPIQYLCTYVTVCCLLKLITVAKTNRFLETNNKASVRLVVESLSSKHVIVRRKHCWTTNIIKKMGKLFIYSFAI